MSSFETGLANVLSNADNVIEQGIEAVASVVQETGDQIANALKGTIFPSANPNPGMGNMCSNQSPSPIPSETVVHPPASNPTPTTRKIPPFNVAHGINAGGKTVLYNIDLATIFPQMDESAITVQDLKTYLSILTSVPPENQQLIHKGAHLNGNIKLITLGIREGSKMMMMGKKCVDPDEEIKKRLSEVEDEISLTSMEVMEIVSNVDSISGGSTSHSPAALQKRLNCLNEAYMKMLMKLDGIEIPSDRTVVRQKRKDLIQRIHSEMEKADQAIKTCDDLSKAFVLVGDPVRQEEESPSTSKGTDK